MTRALTALAAAYGTHLLYTALVLRWRGLRPGPHRTGGTAAGRTTRDRLDAWLVQAGLADVDLAEFAAASVLVAVAGGVVGFALFGGVVAPAAATVGAAALPAAVSRGRRRRRQEAALDAWPRLLEELRIHTRSLGRSVPQALFEVGRRGPEPLRPAFDAAHRQWLLTTDFAASLSVLKEQLADPTADAACETLLLAHEIGGTDLDRRLEALVEDRLQEVHGRKDARAKQAGARFARRFVLIVPLGMAFAGLSIGEGRAAYETALGQVAVVAALAVLGACWAWAGSIMRIPGEQRVFDR